MKFHKRYFIEKLEMLRVLLLLKIGKIQNIKNGVTKTLLFYIYHLYGVSFKRMRFIVQSRVVVNGVLKHGHNIVTSVKDPFVILQEAKD